MVAPLYETYRPKTWADVVGQDKALKMIDLLRQRGGLAGRVYWITGKSGTGKTSVARLIAAEVAPAFATVEMDAADLDLDTVREWERKATGRPLGGGGWCVIVNEAHRLRSPIVSRLLSTFEKPEVQKNVTWIFTTTTDGEKLFEEGFDSRPFASRAVAIDLTERGLANLFAERALEIARAEGLDGQPLTKYLRLVNDHRSNMRSVLCAIEAGVMLAD